MKVNWSIAWFPVTIGGLGVIAAIVGLIGNASTPRTSNSTPSSTTSTSRPAPRTVVQPARTYTPAQVAAAQDVMANIRELATLEDLGSNLRVVFQEFILTADEQTRLGLVRSVADADAIVQGRARQITFHGPRGSQFAQADPAGGIRMDPCSYPFTC